MKVVLMMGHLLSNPDPKEAICPLDPDWKVVPLERIWRTEGSGSLSLFRDSLQHK